MFKALSRQFRSNRWIVQGLLVAAAILTAALLLLAGLLTDNRSGHSPVAVAGVCTPLICPSPTPGGGGAAAPDMVIRLKAETANPTDPQAAVIYYMEVQNLGAGRADSFRVEVPVDQNMQVLSASFTPDPANQRWVSGFTPDQQNPTKMQMEFGTFEPFNPSNPVVVSATVRMGLKANPQLIQPKAIAPSVVRVNGFAFWGGLPSPIPTVSNTVSYIAGGPTTDSKIERISVTSKDVRCSNLTATGNIFGSNEVINAWLNLPDGSVQPLNIGAVVSDKNGVAIASFGLTNPDPGNYSAVLYGTRTGVQGVAIFQCFFVNFVKGKEFTPVGNSLNGLSFDNTWFYWGWDAPNTQPLVYPKGPYAVKSEETGAIVSNTRPFSGTIKLNKSAFQSQQRIFQPRGPIDVAEFSLDYISAGSVTLTAFDDNGNQIDSQTGSGNAGTGASTTLTVRGAGISSVTVTSNSDQPCDTTPTFNYCAIVNNMQFTATPVP